jgi:predicted alpha/beta superfamily hydrolase
MASSSRTYALATCIALSLIASACTQPASGSLTSTLPNVTIPDTEVETLRSANTGRDYDIYVRLPAGYAGNQKKTYPILYVLDGQWDFKLLDSIYGGLYYDEFIPEMIIVGVTYSGNSPDYDALRAKDYTPTPVMGLLGSGDGPKFLTFFKEELIPFVETEYRADGSRRTLMGSSFGGLFTLYAMFTETDLFSGYVAASPAVKYDGRIAFELEAEYASTHQDLPVKLFVGVGELEALAQPVEEFAQIVSERGYDGLDMEALVIEGERHASNKPEAFNRGLRFIFQDE